MAIKKKLKPTDGRLKANRAKTKTKASTAKTAKRTGKMKAKRKT